MRAILLLLFSLSAQAALETEFDVRGTQLSFPLKLRVLVQESTFQDKIQFLSSEGFSITGFPQRLCIKSNVSFRLLGCVQGKA